MIIHEYIRNFEQLGFGMFVHYGLYSISGKGEWTMKLHHIPSSEYEQYMAFFHPDPDWAEQLVHTAKTSGCRYITLTARHHDGFSLYDTCGLNAYDAPHACGRDLIAEFVNACRREDILPFFYHTLADWHEPSYESDFPKYLQYLRDSLRILCTHYGKIAGIWLDGMWDKPDADWEEDALYQSIRRFQPEAMLINNTGLSARGVPGHIELDSVTFERGKPQALNQEDSPKYIASEMCETLNDHWGYAHDDLNYKATGQLISELAQCRRYRSNFLLNTGLKDSGAMRSIDRDIFSLIGQWVKINDEALHKPYPSHIPIQNKPDDFMLKYGNSFYLFCFHLPMQADPHVSEISPGAYQDCFVLKQPVRTVTWLDSHEPVPFVQKKSAVTIQTAPFPYGTQQSVRIAKIELQR